MDQKTSTSAWYRQTVLPKLFKSSGYDYKDMLNPLLNDLLQAISSNPIFNQYVDHNSVCNKIKTAINSWQRARLLNNQASLAIGIRNAREALKTGSDFIKKIGLAKPNSVLLQHIDHVLSGSSEWSGFPNTAQQPAENAVIPDKNVFKPLSAEKIKQLVKTTKDMAPNGVRILFNMSDPYFAQDFPAIRDFVVSKSGLVPGKIDFRWDKGYIDIYDVNVNDSKNAESLYRVAKKLQDMKYENTPNLNSLIFELTGVKMGEAYATHSEEKRQKIRSEKVTSSAIWKNVFPNGPKVSLRFASVMQQLGIDPQSISPEQFQSVLKTVYAGNVNPNIQDKWGPENWPGPFGANTSPEQNKAQIEGMMFATSRTSSIIADAPGSGKCLAAEALCQINGQIYSMEEAYNEFAGEMIGQDGQGYFYKPVKKMIVNSIDDNGNVVQGVISAIYKEKFIGKLKKITTSNGKQIIVSFAHKFLTPLGWSNNIQVGDIICSSCQMPYYGKNPKCSSSLIELMAWQIGEGNEYKNNGQFRIHQNDENVLYRLKCKYDSFGFSTSKIIHPKDGKTSYLQGCSIKYRKELEKMGYVWGNPARKKTIPIFIMKSSKELVRIFLRALFDAEGYSHKNKRSIGITSASKRLIYQVSALLGRFGILHSLHKKIKWATNTEKKIKRLYYELTIIGSGNDIFMKEIGFDYDYKSNAYYAIKSKRNPNKEGKPLHYILQDFINMHLNLPKRHLAIRQEYINGTRGANNDKIDKIIYSFENLANGKSFEKYKKKVNNKWTDKTVAAYESLNIQSVCSVIKQLKILRSNDLQYENIISIDEIEYDGYIYDLTVDRYHNYLAEGGLVCHNTAMAIVAADITRDEGKKVLVVTPNSLVSENWAGKQAKGPMFFCGHRPDQVSVITTSSELEQAIANPEVLWIILRESVIRRAGQQSMDLVNSISANAKKGMFSSLIIDEIQRYKDMDSNSFGKLQRAVSAYHIPFRIGLTGTPSDNTPDDMFVQLMLLRHRALFEDKGTENLVTAQDEVGFADQYLGGADLSSGVVLEPEERKLPEDKQQEIKQNKWTQKATSVLSWVSNLTDDRKKNILDLFATTFIRRDKEDINPKLRSVAPVSEGVIESPPDPSIQKETEFGKGWHTESMKQSAFAKTKTTSKHASDVLQKDPNSKIFVGTQFVQAAQMIAEQINQIVGPGTAIAVTGEIKDEKQRAHIADTFRSPQGTLTDSSMPLRCLIYTSDIGAVGLNFSNANVAIMNDLDWNPSVNEQMFDRIDRVDSAHPIQKLYTSMPNSYDEEMFGRIRRKRDINKAITGLMKRARFASDPKEKVAIANEFVNDIIQNIVIDVGLSPDRQKWFDENLARAFNNEPTESWEDLVAREHKKKNAHSIDDIRPDWIREMENEKDPMAAQYMNQWRNSTIQKLNNQFGDEWKKMDLNDISKWLIEDEHNRIEKQKQQNKAASTQIRAFLKKHGSLNN